MARRKTQIGKSGSLLASVMSGIELPVPKRKKKKTKLEELEEDEKKVKGKVPVIKPTVKKKPKSLQTKAITAFRRFRKVIS